MQIVSVSRRTDVPALYADWFVERLRAGQAETVNPYNANQRKRVSLRPEDVACFVFWSKNPAPLLAQLDALGAYGYWLEYTLNPYGAPIEPGLPPLEARVETLCAWRERAGEHSVVWRYDPILLSETWTVARHIDAFGALAARLQGSVTRCTVSFLDIYPNLRRTLEAHSLARPDAAAQEALLRAFAAIGAQYGLGIETCAEAIDYAALGVQPGACISAEKLRLRTGFVLPAKKDAGQRPHCHCIPSVDIGAYHTCIHGCLYCYANRGDARARKAYAAQSAAAPSLGLA